MGNINYYRKLDEKEIIEKEATISTSCPKTMTLGEILKEWINGHLGVGFQFKYSGQEFVVTDDEIRTIDKKSRGDYSYLDDFEDLFEWIDSSDLSEEAEIINYIYVIEAAIFNNEDNQIQENPACTHSSFKWDNWKYNREVGCCPVCGGNGLVSNGFYNHTGNTWVTSTTVPEQCRSCNGKGYVEI